MTDILYKIVEIVRLANGNKYFKNLSQENE